MLCGRTPQYSLIVFPCAHISDSTCFYTFYTAQWTPEYSVVEEREASAAAEWRSWKLHILGRGRGWKPRLHGGGAVRTLRSLRSLRVLMAAATSSVFLRRERVVEVCEAQAAAVAKAFCQPSEFHHAVCQMRLSLILHVSTRSTRLNSYSVAVAKAFYTAHPYRTLRLGIARRILI